MLGELVFVGGVARDEPEQEVAAAADHVALADFGPGGDQLFEGGEDGIFLAVQADDGEEGDLPAQRLRIGVGMIAADNAGFLQAADAAQAGRGGDAGAAGELDVGHAAVGLQFGEDPAVDSVQFGTSSFAPSCGCVMVLSAPPSAPSVRLMGPAAVAKYYCTQPRPQGRIDHGFLAPPRAPADMVGQR